MDKRVFLSETSLFLLLVGFRMGLPNPQKNTPYGVTLVGVSLKLGKALGFEAFICIQKLNTPYRRGGGRGGGPCALYMYLLAL